jgi:hypothetical protein
LDRSEGALLVAETALKEVRELRKELAELKAAPKGAVSFLLNDAGELVAVFADGQSQTVGKVRGDDGAPGACVLNASIDEGGHLSFMLSDGRTVSAGVVRGKDGEPGKNGESVPVDLVEKIAEERVAIAVAKIQIPRDGKDGEPGRDAADIFILPSIDEQKKYPRGTFARHKNGFWVSRTDTNGMTGWECIVRGFADVEVVQANERNFSVKFRWSDGQQFEKTFSMPVMLDRDVYRAEVTYEKGDTVTYGGSIWIAQVDAPTEKPGEPPVSIGGNGAPQERQWRLAVKTGRQGKSAYEIARANGFAGTEREWLESLKPKVAKKP